MDCGQKVSTQVGLRGLRRLACFDTFCRCIKPYFAENCSSICRSTDIICNGNSLDLKKKKKCTKKQVKHLYRSRSENIDTGITPISTGSYEINYLKDRADFSTSI